MEDFTNKLVIPSGELLGDSNDDYDYEFLLANFLSDNHSMQVPEIQKTQTTQTANPNDYVELGSWHGSYNQHPQDQPSFNQTVVGLASLDVSNYPMENAPEVDELDTSSFNPLLAAIPPAYRPVAVAQKSKEVIKLSPAENYVPQLNQANSDLNISKASNIIGGGSSQSSVSNAPSNMPNSGTSFFNPSLPGTAQQLDGSLESLVLEGYHIGKNHINSSQQQQTQIANFTSGSSIAPPANSHHLRRLGLVSSFNSDSPRAPPYSSAPVGLTQLAGVMQPFNLAQEFNASQPNQPNSLPQNFPQPDNTILLNQCFGSVNQGNPLYDDDRTVENVSNNYSHNNSRQFSGHYQTTNSFPQDVVGAVNETSFLGNNTQQGGSSWSSNSQNFPYGQSSKLGLQQFSDTQLDALMTNNSSNSPSCDSMPIDTCVRTQQLSDPQLTPALMTSNLLDSQNFGTMLPNISLSPRPQQFTPQRQHLDQTPMTQNTPDSPCFSMQSNSSVPVRPQQLNSPHQLNQVQELPNRYNSHGYNSCPQIGSSMPSRSMLFPHHQPNQELVSPNAITPQQIKSFSESSKPSRPQKSSDNSQVLNQLSSLPSHCFINQGRPVTLAPESYVLSRSRSMSNQPQQLSNQGLVTPRASESRPRRSRRRDSSKSDRSQRSSGSRKSSQSLRTPKSNNQRPRSYSVMLEPSRHSWRRDIFEIESLLNGISRGSSSSHSRGTFDRTPSLNVQPPLNNLRQGVQENRRVASHPLELGESSSPSSHNYKGKFPMFPPVSIPELEQEPQNSSVPSPEPRTVINRLYGSDFETRNVPVDPHMRLFALSNFQGDINRELRLGN